ncbi:hypothetical protein TREPR_1697 [Treponema primitia ZAS-2]|uniref:Uncharacterized protein n=1 Tax=Treponema primitia (strain ATCC BAA-887 / DSM 12427 / ZAS-2) TaxID=545694 RepID=F5YMX0_TREPZ|nr:hypothetical protein TREPR_1697 [Treponema primitia ZAS-2]
MRGRYEKFGNNSPKNHILSFTVAFQKAGKGVYLVFAYWL